MNITESPKYAQMCRDYLTFSKSELDGFRSSIAQADFEQIHSVGHKIKGTSGAYQLSDISRAAEKLQQTADNQNTAGLESAFNELYRLIEETLQSL